MRPTVRAAELQAGISGIASGGGAPILGRMVSEFSITRVVEFSETDMAGIVHFSNYFRWMESCETAFYRTLGVPLVSFVPGQVVGWPRVSAKCDYRAPLRFNDTVEVRLFVKEIRTRAVVLLFQFRKVAHGKTERELCAQGEITAVSVTHDARGNMVAAPIPEAFRAKVRMAPRQAWQTED